MGLHIVEEARRYRRLEKLVLIGTTCSYPKHTAVPFLEENFWNGYPEETNGAYGIAKKALLVMARGYREQYGLKSIYLIPANLYGPGDNFDPATSHVIPALIQRFIDSKEQGAPSITIWGTGKPTREFLYVEDAAEGIVLATEHCDRDDPINLATGVEIPIRDLALLIKDLVGYGGEVLWDSSKPDGQPRRCLDVQKASQGFGFRAETSLKAGLSHTIAWFIRERIAKAGALVSDV